VCLTSLQNSAFKYYTEQVMNMMILHFAISIGLLSIVQADQDERQEGKGLKIGRTLPVFQVVRFPNEICLVTEGSKNGTCYTAEECSSKNGVNAGSCASGFGVCCTFTLGCGSSSAENNSYFEVSDPSSGQCKAQICKSDDNVCQIRLDFDTFVITGPSTATVTGKWLTWVLEPEVYTTETQCSTDIFGVTGVPSVPNVCGTLTGDHLYFDAQDQCHDLSFTFGQTAVGASIPTTRKFSIKVSQIKCTDPNKAPSGCTQWYYGTTGVGSIKTFNYDQSAALANQKQVICVRRELGNCQICWNAASITDVQIGGKNTKNVIKHELCCNRSTKATKMTAAGSDCLILPGARLATASTTGPGNCQAGGKGGLVIATGTTPKTLCSKQVPFRVEFYTDGLFYAPGTSVTGVKLSYWMNSC